MNKTLYQLRLEQTDLIADYRHGKNSKSKKEKLFRRISGLQIEMNRIPVAGKVIDKCTVII